MSVESLQEALGESSLGLSLESSKASHESTHESSHEVQQLSSASGHLQVPYLVIVVPCYNESAVIEGTTHVLVHKIHELISSRKVSEHSAILYVDDGSRDDTWEKVGALRGIYGDVINGVKFAHNRGHQNAVYAGMMEAYENGCDCIVSMDADLQDDPQAIDEMIEKYCEGAQIVYGVRNNRDTDTVFKRETARAFYATMTWLGTNTIANHADFRLMGRGALEALSQYHESNLFLRGIVPDLGFKTERVYYKRAERQAGESKYPLGKMIKFALEGITSFSVKPIRFIMLVGAAAFVISMLMLVYIFVSVLRGHAVSGWGSIMASMWLLGGAILMALGIVGEYVGKIYLEVKHRPRYIIEERLGM
ncbi:glycosyltransferase [Alloscardovia theropitheci]|uniref:Glycosyltransferase n=1 Tax=Alloscardovia theropitheci TaxID=2496842 RepID=A0A4R0QPJ7_9BIFI|nr:glycosyltransferase family 2 protein [Alloscardovia theropitheci]TCD54152.1 glycosyltransferase [Alloscardovia theropitheci]